MRGYPKHIATVQDFENLLSVPEHKEQALVDLKALYLLTDDKATRVVTGSEETGDLVTEEIDNSRPLWMQKGFKSREAVADLIKANGGKV